MGVHEGAIGNAHIEKYGDGSAHFNFFRRVFRARSREAEWSISDWVSGSEPGGPTGRELIFHFVEIEPYLLERANSTVSSPPPPR